jgi:calcium-dependent protein kinase
MMRSSSNGVGVKTLTANNRGKDIEQYFNINRKRMLGEGGYASVFPCVDLKMGTSYAVKCVAKKFVASGQKLQNEIDIMLALDHPNIVKLYQTFEDSRFVYLILELCSGGELFDRVVADGRLSEKLTAAIMQQIFRATHYMHDSAGVCHRDLKPENFLLQLDGPIEVNTVKVIDFGIAGVIKPDSDFRTKTGTPFYVAPEIVASSWPRYGAECDLWSCGVIMYVLLCGRLPFKGHNDAATLQKVMLAKFSFPSDHFAGVSEAAKDVVKRLLVKDPLKRMTSEQALNDPWITHMAPSAQQVQLTASVTHNLQAFRSSNRLQKAALHVAAHHINGSQLERLQSLFTQLDEDGNGTLSRDELTRGLRKTNIPAEQIQLILEGIDVDGSGEIDYTEFLAAALERREFLEESACWAAFKVFDRNGDGRITKAELAHVVNSYQITEKWSREQIQDLMNEVDANGDGFIDFEEFRRLLQ